MLENSFGELLFTGEVFPSDCTIAVSFSKSAHCAPFPLQSYVFHLAIAQANLRHSHAFVLTYATLLGFALGQLGPFPAGYYALCPAYSVTNTNSGACVGC